MTEIKRIFPGATNGLLNWIEQNFHDIDGYIVTFNMKDGTTMTVYDCYSYLEALGLVELTRDTIHVLSHGGEFVNKER